MGRAAKRVGMDLVAGTLETAVLACRRGSGEEILVRPTVQCLSPPANIFAFRASVIDVGQMMVYAVRVWMATQRMG
jgi:hypothetical protein